MPGSEWRVDPSPSSVSAARCFSLFFQSPPAPARCLLPAASVCCSPPFSNRQLLLPFAVCRPLALSLSTDAQDGSVEGCPLFFPFPSRQLPSRPIASPFPCAVSFFPVLPINNSPNRPVAAPRSLPAAACLSLSKAGPTYCSSRPVLSLLNYHLSARQTTSGANAESS